MRFLLQKSSEQRWCPSCGKRASEHSNFCANCGAELRAKAETPLSAPPLEVEESPPAPEHVGPALLPVGYLAKNDREKNAAPFPRCRTTEEVLACQEQARARRLTIISYQQRSLSLRAPEPGEEGIVVAETIDDQPEQTKQVFTAKNAATGTHSSRLWVVNDKYPLLGSTAAVHRYDREHAAMRTGKEERRLPVSGKKLPPRPQWSSDSARRITIWRLIAHHEEGERVVQWSLRTGAISIGWGATGDLNHQQFADASELTQVVAFYHPGSTSSSVSGGRSLWRLFYEMEIGDLVILSTGVGGSGRALTMRVTGDYYYTENDVEQDYEHRRKAEAVPIDPNRLWDLSGGTATGESPRWTLIRCANSMTEAEYRALFRSA